MKKLIIALPFVAGAAAIASTSQYAGTQTQGEYHALLARFNNLLPLVFVNEMYESGLTSSTAVTKVMASRTADAEVLFRLQHDIQHGPVHMDDEGVSVGSVSINTRLHDADKHTSEFMALFTDTTPFILKTDVKFTGEISNQLSVSSISISENGEILDWSGMSLDAVSLGDSFVSSGTLGTVTYTDENHDSEFRLDGSGFDIDVQHHGDSIYTGTGNVYFDGISAMSSVLAQPLSLASIELMSNTGIQGDVMSSDTIFSVNGISSPLPVENVLLDIQLDGLMVEGIRQYNRVLEALRTESENSDGDPDIADQIFSILPELVAPGSAMNYAISLNNSAGDVNADLRIALKDEPAEGLNADVLKNIVTPRDLLNILSLNGSLDVDKAALAQTPVMMLLGGDGKYIAVSENSITSEVSLDGASFIVNGVTQSLDELSGGMLDIPFSDLAQM